jgi:hypothetical protein
VKLVSLSLIFLLAPLLSGCSNKTPTPPVLLDYGPKEIRANRDFNKQADGENAIWAHTKNSTPACVLVLDEFTLLSAYDKKTKLLTAIVPAQLYGRAGEYPLYILDMRTKLKSNTISFIVKP